ncbi:cation transporter [Candidatus Peregrinibacteria bacterium]|nr:MAG: cation transporter [Candidatus Peregrinibacteria bacterium]
MADCCCAAENVDLKNRHNKKLRNVFVFVLLVNLVMFFVEAIAGFLSHSNALTADSLDMLADTFVYGISLFVVFRNDKAKARASLLKGIVMSLLGIYVVFATVIKIIHPVLPTAETISIIGGVALLANALCLYVLSRYKSSDLNMKSAWICSRNDVFGNVSVIVAGLLVAYFNSMIPDILVGLGIAVFVLHSSIGIIREALKADRV